jgi:hypothetical protein
MKEVADRPRRDAQILSQILDVDAPRQRVEQPTPLPGDHGKVGRVPPSLRPGAPDSEPGQIRGAEGPRGLAGGGSRDGQRFSFMNDTRL